MIRDMTIGQYYRVDSVLHRLDPRVKIVYTLCYIFALFFFDNWMGLLCSTAFLAIVIHLSKVPLRHIVKGLKAVVVLLLFTVCFHLFLTSGDVVIRLWKLTITKQGIINGSLLAVRFVLIILGSSMMTFTTTPNQLTDGLERLMRPLKKIRVPVHEVAMMMSIALRFIPILMEEADKIMKAQMARGADFESGGLIRRAKSLVPILVPLFLAAFRRADELALAMEARCYRGDEGRTRMHPLIYTRNDRMAYVVLLAFFVIQIGCRIIAAWL